MSEVMGEENVYRLKEYPTSCYSTTLHSVISGIPNNLPMLEIFHIRLETVCVLSTTVFPTVSSTEP